MCFFDLFSDKKPSISKIYIYKEYFWYPLGTSGSLQRARRVQLLFKNKI